MLASPGPLLLVADDLHWADRETLQFLHYLLRAQPRASLLVVATVRPEELDPEHPLHDLLTGLRALDRVPEVEVGRFSALETAAVAERLRRRPLAAAEAERLKRLTALKDRYDPANLFRMNANIPPTPVLAER